MHRFPIAHIALDDEAIAEVTRVLRSGQLIQGQKVAAFEEAFAASVGARYAVAVSSGTAALHVVYLALVPPDREVLVPSFTHISTASMVCMTGAVPVFCDIDAETLTVTAGELARRITPRTAAFAPVHLFGNSCEVDEIRELAARHGLPVIWDAAQALGTRYQGRGLGSFDTVVCYSFYPTKGLTTGEGGAIVTNDVTIRDRCRLLRSHGQERKYHHTSLGLNYRMTEMAAVLGLHHLSLLGRLTERRRRNALYFNERFKDTKAFRLPTIAPWAEHSFHQYCLLLNLDQLRGDRQAFIDGLQRRGVETAVHYPTPVHRQPAFGGTAGSLPVSEATAECILSIPVHPWLTEESLPLIADAVLDTVSELKT
jgi:perosamine synthetase